MTKNYFISKNTIVDTDVSTVFSVLADIENWNSWTRSVTRISYLEHNKFQVGDKATVIQPKLSPALWTIAEIIPNKSFVWQTNSYGVKMTAKHILKETSRGTFIEHQVIYEGLFARLFYKLTTKLTNRYLAMEIMGLKRKCEGINKDIIVMTE
jgi:hypothetical protein